MYYQQPKHKELITSDSKLELIESALIGIVKTIQKENPTLFQEFHKFEYNWCSLDELLESVDFFDTFEYDFNDIYLVKKFPSSRDYLTHTCSYTVTCRTVDGYLTEMQFWFDSFEENWFTLRTYYNDADSCGIIAEFQLNNQTYEVKQISDWNFQINEFNADEESSSY